MIVFAWSVLFLWPVAAIVFYRLYSLPVALCLTLLAGQMLLPNGLSFNLPVLPTLDKFTICALSAAVLTLIHIARNPQGAVLKGWIPQDWLTRIFLGMLFASFFATALTNSDPLVYVQKFIPGLRLYDAFAQSLEFMIVIAPLLLARKVLATAEAQRTLVLMLALSGLIYTLPALYEVRMSPHLHGVFYGFFDGVFMHYARAGGFKPVVFMPSGLELAIYTAFSLLAAACLFRTSKDKPRLLWLFAIVWLVVSLILYKSLGALLIAVLLLPIMVFFGPRTQVLLAACIAATVLVYPTLRATHVIPVDRLLTIAEQIEPARAASLQTRFDNEEALLAKAEARPLFGWGTWGRNRIYTEEGYDITLTDGGWVIQFGIGGWLRYIAIFGIFCWPVIKLFSRHRAQADPISAALALILCAYLVDIILNSGRSPVPWLLIGSLLGRMELLAGHKSETMEKTGRRIQGYARRFPQKEDRGKEQAGAAENSRPGLSYKRSPARLGYRR